MGKSYKNYTIKDNVAIDNTNIENDYKNKTIDKTNKLLDDASKMYINMRSTSNYSMPSIVNQLYNSFQNLKISYIDENKRRKIRLAIGKEKRYLDI